MNPLKNDFGKGGGGNFEELLPCSAGVNHAFRDGQWRINNESFVVVCIAIKTAVSRWNPVFLSVTYFFISVSSYNNYDSFTSLVFFTQKHCLHKYLLSIMFIIEVITMWPNSEEKWFGGSQNASEISVNAGSVWAALSILTVSQQVPSNALCVQDAMFEKHHCSNLRLFRKCTETCKVDIDFNTLMATNTDYINGPWQLTHGHEMILSTCLLDLLCKPALAPDVD